MLSRELNLGLVPRGNATSILYVRLKLSSLPAYAVLADLINQLDSLEHVCDVVETSLLYVEEYGSFVKIQHLNCQMFRLLHIFFTFTRNWE